MIFVIVASKWNLVAVITRSLVVALAKTDDVVISLNLKREIAARSMIARNDGHCVPLFLVTNQPEKNDTTMSILKQARINAKLSVEEVSRQLNIRKHYIIALEEDKLEEIPAGVYAQGYIRMYSKFLGIQIEQEIVKPELSASDPYARVVDTFGGKNNLGMATAVIFALIVGTWFYMLGIHKNDDGGLVQNLENLEPVNYMLNMQEPRKDIEDLTQVDFKLPNNESSSDGLNDTNN